jgi:hypothetical protein
MAKFALLLIGLVAPAGAAEPVTAEMAMERYRETFEPIAAVDCPKSSTADEIIVCGRPDAPDPDRLPLPVAPVPGQRIQGEPVSAVVAMGKRETCSTVGPNQNCGGGLPLIPIAVTAAQIAIKLIKGDD